MKIKKGKTIFDKYQYCMKCGWAAKPMSWGVQCCPECGSEKVERVIGRWEYNEIYHWYWYGYSETEYIKFIPAYNKEEEV